MPYQPGGLRDRQQRVAQTSQDYGQIDAPLPLLSGGGGPVGASHLSLPPNYLGRPAPKEAPGFTDGTEHWLLKDFVAPGQSTLDTRRPAAYLSRTQRSVAQIAGQIDQVSGTPRPLVGKDAKNAGAQTWETTRPAAVIRRQQHAALTAQNFHQVHGTPLPLQGKDAMVTGQSTLDTRRPAAFLAREFRYPVYDGNSGSAFLPEQIVATLPPGQATLDTRRPIAFARAPYRQATYDVNAGNTLIPELVGQDAMATGDQSFDLPPRIASRSVDLLTFFDPSEVWLFGTDALNAGKQSFDLPPLAAARARDYSLAESFPLTLLGQDAMAAGEQSTALPPVGPLRARDYTFASPINLCLATIVQPIPYGAQSTDSLPARAATRARDYTWTQELIPVLVGQDAVTAGQQRFDLAPSPAAPRARDYTWADPTEFWLFGTDAMVVGKQWTDLAPITALRSRDYSFVPPINLCCLTTVVQALPAGQQSTDNLPARGAPRARDYSYSDPTEFWLFGTDAMVAGSQWLHRPPYAAPRVATLYEPGVNFTLGLDAAALKPVGKGSDASALPPKAAARARDYTWLQTLPLHIYQQLPAGQTSQETEGPPRGPLRARDYTFLDLTKRHLIGQDAMVVGESTFISDLPPRAYPRAQSLTVPETHNMIVLFTTARRNPDWDMSVPASPWTAGTPGSPWTSGSLGSRWTIGPAKE